MRGAALWIAALGGLAACSFPDVDYADGGTGGGSTSSSGTGGACTELDTCTSAAMTCASHAQEAWSTCTSQCHNGSGCLKNCDTTHTAALAACDGACTSCAPAVCTSSAASCKTAAGL